MFKPRFVHLRVHSDYSMIDGLVKIETLIQRAITLHMPALAITDFTNLYGVIKFYRKAYKAGIKPIIGADFLLQNKILNKELTELTILASNNIGYRNLILLISHAYKHGYSSSYGPLINHNWLTRYNEGLILISRACKGDIGKCLMRNNIYKLDQCLSFYENYFKNRYYLEIIRTGRIDEERYLHNIIKLADCRRLPVVATNDVRFIMAEDFEYHEIRVAIHDGYALNDVKRPQNYSKQQYMRSEQEMCELFYDIPEALENTIEIAKRCNVTITHGDYFLPKFPTGIMSVEDYLIACAQKGLENRLHFLFPDNDILFKKRELYDKRLNNELHIINKMGFPSYFLIVMEFIQWAKENGVSVGPGRGSGAGSLVAYALNITDIDPIAFNLLFERFLNPDRVSMPDFDIDFCMDTRDLVIDHVAETYGRESVAQIITFNTMTAKAVIRDVGRVLGYPYGFVNRISKLIPADPGITLKQAIISEKELKYIYDSDEDVKTLIDMSRKLEGVTRSIGKHAGGVVISPTKITDFMPLYFDSECSNPVTQFDKDDVEYVGLVKFDFLGLRTLTIINNALKMINAKRVLQSYEPIDIASISLSDKKSFDILHRSETTAVFQLESRGMKDLIKRLKPDCFEDMIALIALFRPGPLQSGMVDNFINRKHGLEPIYYPDRDWQHLSLKPVLDSTYGVIIYQEQVMKIAQILANYTLGEADILRRAIGKKKHDDMSKQRLLFKLGSQKIGINCELSMKIFDILEKFAGYGFNKSHSAAYALVSYQTLWLKTHYPAEFMAAVMTAYMDNTEKIVVLVEECLRLGLKVIPPNINISQYYFKVNEKNEIVYGLGAIKGIGEKNVEAIIESRNKNGNYNTLWDLCIRIDNKKLNRRVLEKLIMSGALDNLGQHRAELMNSIINVLKATDQHIKNNAIGQSDMFSFLMPKALEDSYVNVEPWPEQMVLDGERETLGLYLTGHPINQHLREIEYYSGGMRINDLYCRDNKVVTAVGLVLFARVLITKKGNSRIGMCTIDDRSGRLDVIVFENILEKYQYLLVKDRILIIKGKIKFNNFKKNFKMIASELMDIIEAREKYVRKISIYLIDKNINDQFLHRLILLLEPHRCGKIPIYFYFKNKYSNTKLGFNEILYVKPTDKLLSILRKVCGNDNVKLEFH